MLTSQITRESFERIVGQCEPTLVLLEEKRADLRASADAARVISVDAEMALLEKAPAQTLPSPDGGDALAFPRLYLRLHGNAARSHAEPRERQLCHAGHHAAPAISGDGPHRCFLPLSFDYGFYQIFYALMRGSALFIGRPEMSGPELPRIFARHEITVLPGVPTLFAGLIKRQSWRPVSLPHLRVLTNTGDHLPLPHIRQLQQLFQQPGFSRCTASRNASASPSCCLRNRHA